jgi:peptidoglycan/xylan/chitin deacetylase (PgdA/CDA1 family)
VKRFAGALLLFAAGGSVAQASAAEPEEIDRNLVFNSTHQWDRYDFAIRKTIVNRMSHALCTLCFCLPGLAWLAPDRAQASEPCVTILVYHRFSETADDSMTVRMASFETQLRFLKEHGYHIVPLRDAVRWLSDPESTLPVKPVVITVDDGHRSVFEKLLPIVLRDRFPVTLFVYPSALSNASYALTWEQLRTLKRTGWFDIQSHSYWHPNFKVERRHRTAEDFQKFVRFQLDASRQKIASETGSHVDMLAWPFGIHDDQLAALASGSGYVAAFTLEGRAADRHSKLLALPRFLMMDTYGPAALAHLLGEDRVVP